MKLSNLLVAALAGISVAVIFIVGMLMMLVSFAIELLNIATDAVCDFLEYHYEDQWDVMMSAWYGEEEQLDN